MDRNDVSWKGYWPASPTPFTRAGELDEPTLRSLMRFYLENGMHGVLVNGSTGEWWSQSDAERKRVAEIAVDELHGKIPVVVGVTTFTARSSAELGKHAAAAGTRKVQEGHPESIVQQRPPINCIGTSVAELVLYIHSGDHPQLITEQP